MASHAKKEKKKMNKFLKGFLIFLLIIVIIASAIGLAGYLYLTGKLNLLNRTEIDKNAVGINEEVIDSLKGYRNIALLAIDSRADEYGKGYRSDGIIIASINEKTGEINLISVYRDTYLRVEEYGKDTLDKITHAYSYGVTDKKDTDIDESKQYDPAQNTLRSLNQSLDLNITEFVTVNFDAVIDAVDALGGVDITLDESEVKYINEYISALNSSSHKSSSRITSAGTHHLDGVQAVAYSRIRYTEGGDYKRAQRMRTVLEAMFNKAKELNISELNNLADRILPRINTNLSNGDITGLLTGIFKYKINESHGWPYSVTGYTTNAWVAVPTTLESNVVKLHKELFKDDDYVASKTVKEISNEIISKTGLSTDESETKQTGY